MSQRNVDPKDIDEEKNRDQLFLLLRCIKHPDFVLPKYPHEQIRIAYRVLVRKLNEKYHLQHIQVDHTQNSKSI